MIASGEISKMSSKKAISRVQGSDVDYELHTLGWKAFQQLCLTIVAEYFGQNVQSFCDGNDGGRDGAFSGRWVDRDGTAYDGNYVVQSKYSVLTNVSLTRSKISDELKKAEALAAKGLCRNYFLMTNMRVTAELDARLREDFEKIEGLENFRIFGVNRITQMIRESAKLRRLVPRIYGIGDLSEIFDERAYGQAIDILSSLGGDLKKFVITGSFRQAAEAISKHGFVFLLGEPACGKSTIAAALALGALDTWNCHTIKVPNAEYFISHSNSNTSSQFFWVDDVFGSTQTDWQQVFAWNQAFPHVQAAIKRGAKIIFTSRDYIYKSAKSALKQSALPLMMSAQVVVQVKDISHEEREQILYNHIKMGGQTSSFKSSVKSHLPMLAELEAFNPEAARRLGNPLFTKDLHISRASLQSFVENPMSLLIEVIETMDESLRSAIALVFVKGGRLESPIDIDDPDLKIVSRLGTTENISSALSTLNDGLLMRVQESARSFWVYKHPTIRDAFATLVSANLEWLDIYVSGTPLQRLFLEITCGNVGLEGVKVILPSSRFAKLIARINGLIERDAKRHEWVSGLCRFLSNRCDKEFLSHFVKGNNKFLSSLRIGSYFSISSELHLLAKLTKLELLPEEIRIETVKRISASAKSTPDADFLLPSIKPIFKDVELNALIEEIRFEVIFDLESVINDWTNSYEGDDDPVNYFSLLISALESFKEHSIASC